MSMLRGLLATRSGLKFWIIVALVTLPVAAFAVFPNQTFFKNRMWSVRFSTASQTNLAGRCSSVVTARSHNSHGVVANVPANLTVNLTGGANTIFYADNICTQPITTVTILAGTSTANFYFIDTSVGGISIGVGSSGYFSNQQVHTSSTNGFIWTGGGGDSNWTNAANWSGGVVPGAANVAIFDGTCSSNCSPQINSNINVAGVRVEAPYTGTITQVSGFTLTIGSIGWIQRAGTFAGGDSSVTMTGPFYVDSTSYTATSATWTHTHNFTVSGSPTFNANSGTVVFNGASALSSGNAQFNNVSFGGSNIITTLTGTMKVNGTLTLNDTSVSAGSLNTGTIEAAGNVVITNYGKRGSTNLKLTGGANQSVSGSANANVPSLEIASTGGTVVLDNSIRVNTSFTNTSGTIDASTSTILFVGSGTIVPGTLVFNDVTFAGSNTVVGLSGGTMTINGDLTLADTNSSSGQINSGTLLVNGDITASSFGKRGSALIKVGGSANQTITSVSTAFIPAFEVASTGGTVTFSGILSFDSHFTYTSGTVVTTGTSVMFNSTSTILAGSVEFENVTFGGSNRTATLSGSLTVKGTLTLADSNSSSGSVNSGSILAYGNVVSSSYGKIGTTILMIVGSTSQTVSGTVNAFFPHFEIASTAGTVNLTGILRFNGNYTYTSGTMDLSASDIHFLNTATVKPGPFTYNNVMFSGGSRTISLNSETMTINGTLTLNDTSSSLGYVNSGTILAYGNVVLSNYGKLGNAVLKVIGSSNQTVAGSANAYVPDIELASTGGTVTVTGSIRCNSNFTYTSGTVDMSASSLVFTGPSTVIPGPITYGNVSFAGNNRTQSLSGGTMTVNGTLTLADTSSSLGNVNLGTIVANGNVTIASYGKLGSALIKIAGSANQAISGVATGFLPDTEIVSTGGTVSFVGTLKFNSAFTYTSGTVDAGTSELQFVGTSTLIPGAIVFNNVRFAGTTKTANLGGGTMTVNGDLFLADTSATTGSVNSGTIVVRGNITSTIYGKLGSAVITLSGGGNQTLSQSGTGKFPVANFVVNKSGGSVSQLTAMSLTGASTLTVTNGSWSMSGFNLTVAGGLSLNGNTITKSGGVLTVTGVTVGTGSLYGGTVSP